MLEVWSSYLHHLNTYIEGIQNDVRHGHISTTPHPTLFRTRENVVFIQISISRMREIFLRKMMNIENI